MNIDKDGHEVALHGYDHYCIDKLSENKFKEDIKKSIEIIYDLIGKKPIGFRAPNFSVTKKTSWAFKILKKNGFLYDSSIFPFNTTQYGNINALRHPYYANLENPFLVDRKSEFIEYPILTSKFLHLPFSGGFYLRLFGPSIILNAISNYNKEGYSGMCYFHLWELYGFPYINMPYMKKIYAYYRIPCYDLFKSLLKKIEIFPTSSILKRDVYINDP